MKAHEPTSVTNHENGIVICGARYAVGPWESTHAFIQITGGRVTSITSNRSLLPRPPLGCPEVDLSGFLIMPGLINSHDHLEFALFPRLGNPPYRNYIDWGADIHDKFPEIIAMHRAVPKPLRLWWGGIRNLLCGVTTVCHHNPLWPDLQRIDFPVRVVQEYGWGHSLALGGDLRSARSTTPDGGPFIVHACEGVDREAQEELWGLDRLKLVDASAVLVHGLAIDHTGAALMRERQASLIVCPSSNKFLFGMLPDMSLLGSIENVALGNDSPLTAEGDLLDEIRFAIRYCDISPDTAYRMVTEAPAAVLRLRDSEGLLKVSGAGDLIAIRDTSQNAADRLPTLSMKDIEFVMIRGQVKLASSTIMGRLPLSAKQGLRPLSIDGNIRWLRAPVGELLRKAEEALGPDAVWLGGKPICIPAMAEVEHAC